MPSPFFIVGNDRSGTTMLRLILDAGLDAAIPPESMFLTDYGAVRQSGGLHETEAAARFMREVWRHPKVRLWELPPPPAVPPGLSHEAAYRFIVEAPFLAYARKTGKAWWGDKTPHYLHHIDELLELWPEARVVVMVRDGRDVALSVRRLPFGPNNAWAAAQWWARGIRVGQRAQAAHPESVMTIRYEDLASRPADHVPRICAFLGLRFTAEMLAIERTDHAKIVADQRGWFPTLFDGIHTAAIGRWRDEMPLRDQRIFAGLAADELAAFAYDRGPAARLGVSPWQERLFRYHNETMRQLNFVRLRLVAGARTRARVRPRAPAAPTRAARHTALMAWPASARRPVGRKESLPRDLLLARQLPVPDWIVNGPADT